MTLMEFAPKTAAEIWRLLLPPGNLLFDKELPRDECVFAYRSYIFFVHADGAVVRMKKPANWRSLNCEEMREQLRRSRETFDYDDEGIFEIGGILRDIGFLVPVVERRGARDYEMELVDLLASEKGIYRQRVRGSFRYALFRALLRCEEMNASSEGESEFAVRRINECDEADQATYPF
ncbi:hypothetical protein BSNK01_27780 [Bacillaceae bacterium]